MWVGTRKTNTITVRSCGHGIVTDYYRFLPLNTAIVIVTYLQYRCIPLNTASVIVTALKYRSIPLNVCYSVIVTD